MVVHVDVDAPATVLAQKAERRIALQDRLLPEPERALLGLIARDELSNVLQQVERQVAALHIGEEIQLDRLAEDPSRDAFLDQRGPRAVLRLVDLRIALALQAEAATRTTGDQLSTAT